MRDRLVDLRLGAGAEGGRGRRDDGQRDDDPRELHDVLVPGRSDGSPGRRPPIIGGRLDAVQPPASPSRHGARWGITVGRGGEGPPRVTDRPEPRMSDTERIDPRVWIRDVPDFPKPGILFKDITPMLGHPEAFRAVVDRIAEAFAGRSIDAVAAAEARGFIFGRPWRWRWGPASCRSASLASSRIRRSRSNISSNTAPIAWRCTTTPSGRAGASCWSTTSWPPAGPCAPAATSSSGPAPRSSPAPSSSSCPSSKVGSRLEPGEVFSLITY